MLYQKGFTVTFFRITLSLFILSLWVTSPRESAAKEDPASVAKKIQAAYDKITDLQTDFVQTVRFQDFDTPYVSKGKLFLKKGKMRWDYQEPSRQQIVVEGETATFYIPEHKQVIKSRIGGQSDSHLPLQLLSGTSRLDQDFQISIEEERPDKSLSLRLTPKSKETQVSKVLASVAPSPQVEGLVIQKVTLFEENGNVSTFSFEGMQINKGIGEDLFVLKIPKGTEVIDSP
ncbi:MAG: outer membrane lipoprotein carrier protein LolA [Nitrospirae bacterium]|nr:outer membrane lipoprotein carrier protein LolA [Candidatus Manganitrophaceae bacterium]